MRILLPVAAAVVLTIVAAISIARSGEKTANGIAVTAAWARATPPGASTGAGYVTVENSGREEDRLVGAISPVAASVLIHQTSEWDGIARMRAAGDLLIQPGETLAMRPGGAHLMLIGLSAPLAEGDKVPVTLAFEKAGAVTVDLAVAPIGAGAPADARHLGPAM